MAITSIPTLGTTGIDLSSSAQLLRTARLFASDPELSSLINPDEREAQWVELDSSPEHQIWLLSWPAGTYNGWHDHGDSASAFQVVSGSLLEKTSHNQRREFRTIMAGEGRSLEQNQIHELANVRTHTALSVHVYAPRLTTTTWYAITPTGLQSKSAVGSGFDW